MKQCLTLMELIITLIVLVIIAAFAIPGYQGVRQRAQDREAQTMLLQIQAAERTRRFENQKNFIRCDNTVACNAALGLALTEDNFTYRVKYAKEGNFCADATPIDDAGTSRWCINNRAKVAQPDRCNNWDDTDCE